MAINMLTVFPTQMDGSDPAGYPLGKAQNITVPGDGLGTPWDAANINDIIGLQQALLTIAGIVPSGTPDKADASQYLDAIQLFSSREIITATGPTTTPAWAKRAKVTIVGGQGGGGGSSTGGSTSGGAGGSGGKIAFWIDNPDPSYSVTIGAGGALGVGGVDGAAGGTGGNSLFGLLATADGGNGATATSGAAGLAAQGGRGGTATLVPAGGLVTQGMPGERGGDDAFSPGHAGVQAFLGIGPTNSGDGGSPGLSNNPNPGIVGGDGYCLIEYGIL